MEYEKYLEKIKASVKNSTTGQRLSASCLLLIIAGIGIFLYDPAKKLSEMRNSQRRSDVVNILNAVYQYRVDNDGKLPENISSTPAGICSQKASSCEGMVDISKVLEGEKKLLSEVPIDPKEKNPDASGYQIYLSANGRINVKAPLAENNAVINLSK